jgi:sugar lactone lactonase YvrE
VDVTTGKISTVAGNGKAPSFLEGPVGDGGPATAAELSYPTEVAFDKDGNLYIADNSDSAIRKVTTSTGIITTVAGNGIPTYSGDGGPATKAGLSSPNGIAFDGSDNLYIADEGIGRIRKVEAATGIITTVAGNGDQGYSGDGRRATRAEVDPLSLAIDKAGNIYFGTIYGVCEVSASTGIVTTVAGNKAWLYSGDGGSATVAGIRNAPGIALDAAESLYIADNCDYVVRKVTFASIPQ